LEVKQLKTVDLKWLLEETDTALIIVDVQNEFCHPDGEFARRGFDVAPINRIIPNLSALANAAHAHNVPVIYIQNIEEDATDSPAWTARPDGDENISNSRICQKGSWSVELYGLSPESRDFIFRKFRFSAFFNTVLNTFLRARKIETVIVCGLLTNICVETTVRDACMLDYYVVVPEDACFTWHQTVHEMSLSNIRQFFGKVTDTETIIRKWSK